MRLTLLGGVFGVLLLGAAFYVYTGSPHAVASKIAATCAKISGDHAQCYETQVPALYPRYSVRSIFDVIRKIRTLDSSYQFCHVLAHKVGERVVAEDPERWLDAIPLNPPDGLCSNGFIHGVIGGRFRTEVLDDKTLDTYIPEFARACEPRQNWQPSDLDRAICYHGLGHLFDFITNADLEKALGLCRKTAPNDLRRVCIEGVFMQIYQPLEPDDYELIAQMPLKPTASTVRQFCARFKDPVYVSSCMSESWPLSRESIMSGTGAAAFCAGYPNAEEEGFCYRTISSIVGRLSLGDTQKAGVICNNFPQKRQTQCYASSAQAILEEERTRAKDAIALCKSAPYGIQIPCMQELIQHATFVFGADIKGLSSFCAALPTSLQNECLDSNYSR